MFPAPPPPTDALAEAVGDAKAMEAIEPAESRLAVDGKPRALPFLRPLPVAGPPVDERAEAGHASGDTKLSKGRLLLYSSPSPSPESPELRSPTCGSPSQSTGGDGSVKLPRAAVELLLVVANAAPAGLSRSERHENMGDCSGSAPPASAAALPSAGWLAPHARSQKRAAARGVRRRNGGRPKKPGAAGKARRCRSP